MRVGKRPLVRKPQSPYDAFITGIIEAQGQPAECRLRVAEAPAFRQALWDRLAERGLKEHQVLTVLHGRLAGVCPVCHMRLSLEYLEWLCSAPAMAASGRAARELDRFAEGRCVNAECSGTELVLRWSP